MKEMKLPENIEKGLKEFSELNQEWRKGMKEINQELHSTYDSKEELLKYALHIAADEMRDRIDVCERIKEMIEENKNSLSGLSDERGDVLYGKNKTAGEH